MKQRKMKTNRLFHGSTGRLLAMVVAALVAATFTVGCDGEEVTVGENDDHQSNQDDPDNQNDDQEPHNHHHNDHDEEYFEAHGPDDDEELIAAGELQGSWRASFVEGDEPLAYFDVFHDEGESTASGDFTQGLVPHDFYDGTTGSIDSIELDGSELEVSWNPTDDGEEMFTLVLEQDDEETYSGTFEAANYPNTYEAKMTLRHIE